MKYSTKKLKDKKMLNKRKYNKDFSLKNKLIEVYKLRLKIINKEDYFIIINLHFHFHLL